MVFFRVFYIFWLAMSLCTSVVAGGGRAPDVTLTGLDGLPHGLDQYIGRGKWVVLNIWGPRCPPCVDEVPELQSFHEDNADDTAIVVGMALDFPSFRYANRDEVEAFVDDYFMTFPILLGDAGVVPRFGAGPLQGVPTSLLFNRGGELIIRHVGALTQKALEDFIRRQEASGQ